MNWIKNQKPKTIKADNLTVKKKITNGTITVIWTFGNKYIYAPNIPAIAPEG